MIPMKTKGAHSIVVEPRCVPLEDSESGRFKSQIKVCCIAFVVLEKLSLLLLLTLQTAATLVTYGLYGHVATVTKFSTIMIQLIVTQNERSH